MVLVAFGPFWCFLSTLRDRVVVSSCGGVVVCPALPMSLQRHRVVGFCAGDELLGMDGARYLKLDDFKDQDDDFLSPKKTLRDFEPGMGTT